MKTLTPGHKYELNNFESGPINAQVIQFIEKEQNPDAPEGSCITVNDGTTNEEVLEMLIDRCKYLNESLPSRETSIAITKMQEALLWLNERTRDRKERGVETLHKS
ncbi:hypothetical protein JYU20_00600 [Bacteroidales bacterium AH-315-I05]|nr:hypothetical protein [Bacteroidales bacterium AH-315-I05]